MITKPHTRPPQIIPYKLCWKNTYNQYGRPDVLPVKIFTLVNMHHEHVIIHTYHTQHQLPATILKILKYDGPMACH